MTCSPRVLTKALYLECGGFKLPYQWEFLRSMDGDCGPVLASERQRYIKFPSWSEPAEKYKNMLSWEAM